MKICTKCGSGGVVPKEFRPDRAVCRRCNNRDRAPKSKPDVKAGKHKAMAFEKELRDAVDRDSRRKSDFDALKPVDYDIDVSEFDTSISNSPNPRLSSQAAREKRQEFNAKMGRFATDFADATEATSQGAGTLGENLPESHAAYIRLLAEQERRFGNRRWARTLAIAEAHEQLSREAMMFVAETYFKDKIEPTGYAKLPGSGKQSKRTVTLLLSDLHLGSELDSMDEPLPFTAIQEARRLEYLLRQFVEYKPQYRKQSKARLVLNGDLIEGLLMHDFRSGSPLAEQKAIFYRLMLPFIGHVAAMFPAVDIVCQPGNHGRDKLRHPGRATTRRWDSHEFEMYQALQLMCDGLKNVNWQIDFRGVSIVDSYGQTIGVTHGDAEVKLAHPDAGAKNNAREFDRINSTRLWGCEFDAWLIGHYHTPRYVPGSPKVIYNGALVPPNGHARANGYIGEKCGQFLFESVEGYPIGDVRYIEVGPSQDNDPLLGDLIKPFRFSPNNIR